ncbi:MAG: DUF4349 domain-containing protein [Candidatus Woesebacteria bacterium]|jgi:hypothetical protein
MKKHTPLLITIAILGLITALATLSVKGRMPDGKPLSSLLKSSKKAALVDEEVYPAASFDSNVGGSSQGQGVETLERKISPSDIETAGTPYYPSYPDDALEVDERLYEKSSSHNLVADDVSSYIRQIKEYFLSIDGRILSTETSSNEKYQYGHIYAKIPVEKFDEATTRVANEAKKVISENITAQDRTGQLVNKNEAIEKLENQKALKEIELEEAKTESQRKKIQLEIDRLERQIEAAKKSLESTETRISYASVVLTVADSEAFFNPRTYRPSLLESLRNAWDSASSILYLVAQVAIWVLVYAVIWLPIVLVLKWLGRRLMGKKK